MMRREVFLRTTAAFGAGLALGACEKHPAAVPDFQPSPEPSVTFAPNAWVHVRTDGTVAVMLSKSEMGQGVYTGLPMLVAEELDVPFDRIRVQFAPADDAYADPVFKDMTTGGSTSMQNMYPLLRGAGAAARAMLIAAAAKQWNVDPSTLTTKAGTVVDTAGKRTASYADLAVAAGTQTPPKSVKLKDTSQFTLIGTSPKRLDLDAKVRAKATYGIDVVVPGMVYANVLKAPTFGGTADTVHDAAARKVHGVLDVVRISKVVKQPVKVTWRREDDMKNDFYRPMSVNVVRAKLDRNGGVAAWEHRVASPSIIKRWLPPMFTKGVDFTAIDQITPAFYAFASTRSTYADFEPGVPVGFMRALGANWNTFVTESFVDELAHAAGNDPVEFRLGLLDPKKGARMRSVLQLAAQKSGWWRPRRASVPQGVALADWGGSLAALVGEVMVSGKDVKVLRVVIAADCGTVVHPDIVAAQLEGAINYGIAMAMTAKITFTDGKVDQNNFYDYTVLRMPDAPKIETYLVKSSEKPSGIGELGTPPIAPAIANAIFQATGRRVRRLPFSDGLA